MKKLLLIVSAIIASLLLPTMVFAQSTRTVLLPANQVVNHDYFAAGDTVHISGTVHGDVYVAGQTVIIDGTVDGDVIAAGKILTVSGTAHNLRVAGQTLTIDGKVTGNITGAAQIFQIQRSASVAGSLVGAGRDITVAAALGKGATIWGDQIAVQAPIHGDVSVSGSTLDLSDTASVSGNLSLSSNIDMTKSPMASIAGRTIENAMPSMNSEEANQKLQHAVAPIFTVFKFASFFSTLLVALLLILIMPSQLVGMAEIFLKRPGRAFGIGALAFFVTPIVIFILFITLIGMPLALILLLIYILCLYFAKIVGVFAISQRLFGTQKLPLFSAFLITLIIYEFVQLIPIIGGLATFVIFLMGLGAMLTEKRLSLKASK